MPELTKTILLQGFQLIVMPDKHEVNMNASHYMHSSRPNSGSGQVSNNHFKCVSNMISKTSTPMRSSIVQSTITERTKDFLLSIGRIFHKIGLVDSEITVTRYRPRHPYPPINVDYRYRFQAPQHSTYEISGVNFTTEKLEHFNWNYMDQYICTRGDTDYLLQEVQIVFTVWFSHLSKINRNNFRLPFVESKILALSNVFAAKRASSDEKNSRKHHKYSM